MYKKIIYLAFDMTEFESEQECREYEKFKENEKYIVGLNEYFEDTNHPGEIVYVYLANQDIVDAFKKQQTEEGYVPFGIDTPDFYLYTEDGVGWVKMDEKIKRLIQNLITAKEKLLKKYGEVTRGRNDE